MITQPNPAAGVTVVGPDQKKYQFPKGTTKDQAVAYFKKKGIGVPKTAPAASTQASDEVQLKPFAAPTPDKLTWSYAGKQAVQGVKELGQSVYDLGKDIVKNPNWVFGQDSVAEHAIFGPAGQQAKMANAAWKLHQYDRAGIHEIAGALPLVGPWVGNLYEQAVTGDPLGALAKGEAQMFAMEGTGKVADIAKKGITPESLRTRAGKLDVKASGADIPEKALDQKEMAQAGRAMAEAKIIATKATLPRQLDNLIKQKMTQVDIATRQAEQAGKTADVTQALNTAVDTAKQRAAVLGDKTALDNLDKWKYRQTNTLDPQTKRFTPNNLTAMKPTEVLNKTRALEKDAGWEGGQTPEAIKNASKLYRQALNDHLDQMAPGTAKLRADESALIKNREGSLDISRKAFEGAKATFVSYFRSPGTLAMYALLKGLGASWVGAIAPVVGLKTMWDSTLSRTTRAAILEHAANIIEGKRQSAAARGGAPPAAPTPTPTAGGTPPTPSPQPTIPQSPPLTVGGHAIPALAAQNPVLQAAPTIQAVQQAQALLPPSAPVEAVMVKAQQIKAANALQAAVGPVAPESASSASEAPTGQPNAAKPLQGNNLQAPTPAVTKVAEGVSGVGPKAKAMLDRLDELTQRVPKSGKDRQDIAREIEEIKKAASEGTTDAEKKAINKRVVDRERQARHRAKAQAETPGATSTGAAEPVSGSNPESATILIDQGLNKLSEMGDLGKQTAKGIRREAIQRKWSPAEQMAQIAEAIEFLRLQPQHEGDTEVPMHPPESDDSER